MANDKPPKREKVANVRQSARHTIEIVHEGLDPTKESPDAILKDAQERLFQIAQDYSKANKPRPFRVSMRFVNNSDGTVDLVSYISDAAASPLSEDVALALKPFVLKRAARKDSARVVDKGGGPDGSKPAPPKAPPRPPRKKKPVDAVTSSATNEVKSDTNTKGKIV
jgi:hypothetical protein